VDGGRTNVRVEELEREARVEEVAHVLTGKQITDTSLPHTRELIAGAARN
jgi:DNA repair ATPase RecN